MACDRIETSSRTYTPCPTALMPTIRGQLSNRMSDPSAKRATDSAAIPAPAHPERRRQPLPWCRPKPSEEDPDAMARVQAILRSPAYREATEDAEFLGRPETRGAR